MSLARLLSLPYIQRYAGRYCLLVAGVSLGSALFLSMQASSQALTASFRNSVERGAGTAQLQVSGGGAGVPEALLERLQLIDAVERAVPVVEASVELRSGVTLLVLGLDLTSDLGMRDYSAPGEARARVAGLDPLTFIAQPDSLLITSTFAQNQGLHFGDQIPLRTMQGEKSFTVRGLLPPHLPAFGANIAIMDVYAAQVMFGRGERFDRIDVRLRPGIPIEEGRSALLGSVGPGIAVDRPQDRSTDLDQLLNAFGLLQNSIGFAALLLGMAMIQSSFRLAVMQRFAEIGVLRALGATQKQIASVFLWEGAAVGLLGALLGLGLGILLSTLIAGYLNELLRGLLGSSSMGGSSLPGSGTILATIAVSVVTSIVAAFGPARSAAQLTPAAAMRAIPTQQPPSVSTLRAIAGVCALAISASVSPQSAATFYISLTLSFLGIVCLAPFMSLQLVRLARPLLARVWPLEGPLASDSLTQTSARTAPILTMLTMAFGQVIIVGGVAESAHATLADWVDRSFDQDLLISGSSNLVNRSLTFPADVQQQLASVAGVRSVEAVRQVDVRYESRTVLLLARDLTADCLRKGPVVVQGSWPGICRDVASGHGVVISENLGAVAKLARGDVFRFVTPSGPWELPVVGVVRDLQDPRGTVMIGWELYCRLWGDERIDKFRIFVAAGHSVDAVRASILERVGSKVPLTAFSREDVNEFIFRPAGRSLKGSYVQILIAGIIATLSLMNFLAISVVERRVFLAVFRTLGMTKAGVRKTLAIEALLAAGVGIVLGIACGALCLRLVLAATYSMVAGVRLEYSLPVGTMFALIPVAAIASILAAWLPVQHMFRSSLTESLARE